MSDILVGKGTPKVIPQGDATPVEESKEKRTGDAKPLDTVDHVKGGEADRARIEAAATLAKFQRLDGLSTADLQRNIRGAFGSVGELAEVMRESHGVFGDLLYCGSFDDFWTQDRQQALQEQTARIVEFRTQIKDAKALKKTDPALCLETLQNVADNFHEQWLPAKARNELMNALKNSDFGAAVTYWEKTAARWPVYREDDIGREYYVVANNKAAEKAVSAAEKAIKKGAAVGKLLDAATSAVSETNHAAATVAMTAAAAAITSGAPAAKLLGKAVAVLESAGHEDAKGAVDKLTAAVAAKASVGSLLTKAAPLLQKSILEGKSYIAERSDDLGLGKPANLVVTPESMATRRLVNSEMVAAVGKAFYVARGLISAHEKAPGVANSADLTFLKDQLRIETRDLMGKVPPHLDYTQAALEVSTRYYEAGHCGDFAYYPAMPAIYQNFELGNVERAEALLEMASVATQAAGGKQNTDFWCLQSQLEIALMRRDHREVIDLLPIVLPQATEGWHLDSTAYRMETLAAQRAEVEGDDAANVKLLRMVANEFKDRAYALYDGKAGPADVWNAKVIDAATQIAALPEVVIPEHIQKGRALSKAIRDNSISFRMLSTSHAAGARLKVGGNGAWGGQIPDVDITRTTRRTGLDLLSKLGIDGNTAIPKADVLIRDLIDRQYRYIREGERVMEDLKSGAHKEELDPYAQYRFVIAMAREAGDDATELFTEMQLQIGDCRPAGWAMGYLQSLAEQLRLGEELKPAFAALPSSTASTYYTPEQVGTGFAEHIDAAREELRSDVRVFSWKHHAPMAGDEEYVIERDDAGRIIPSDDGKPRYVEAHTGPTRFEVDDNDCAANLSQLDAFYQRFYPGWGTKIDLEAFAALFDDGVKNEDVGQYPSLTLSREWKWNKDGTREPIDVKAVHVGYCQQLGDDGELTPMLDSRGQKIPYFVSVAGYSGGVIRTFEDGAEGAHAGATWMGHEVGPGNAASIMTDDGGEKNPLTMLRWGFALSLARAGVRWLAEKDAANGTET